MTIRKLHRMLGELIDSGNGKSRVYIYKGLSSHPLELYGDGTHRVNGVRLKQFVSDKDGSTKRGNDNPEIVKTRLVLFGKSY
jgi:hypothetical protein